MCGKPFGPWKINWGLQIDNGNVNSEQFCLKMESFGGNFMREENIREIKSRAASFDKIEVYRKKIMEFQKQLQKKK